MDEKKARYAVQQARMHMEKGIAHIDQAVQLLDQLRERGGYSALGYASFNALFEAEFADIAHRCTLHRWRRHLQLVDELIALFPAGTQRNEIAQNVTRNLSGLNRQQRDAVVKSAVEDAGDGEVTGRQIEDAKYQLLLEELGTRYIPVQQRVRSGELTPKRAYALVTALEECKARVRPLILKHKIDDLALIRRLNEIAGSDTYEEIADSGTLHIGDEQEPVLLADLTPSILRDELNRRAKIHREGARTHAAVVSTLVYPDDPEATRRNLLDVMTPAQLERFAQHVLDSAARKAG